jgi:predicted peroxiredoxin
MAVEEKLVIMVTHGPDEAELATIPFVVAGAAVASDVQVVMGFQAEGVRLVERGTPEKVEAPGLTPLAKLLEDVRALGGLLLVCVSCIKSRNIAPEDLIEGAEVVAAGRFVAEILSATNSLVY